MLLAFELLFPLLWLYLGWRIWRANRWQAALFAAFYLFCLACEAVAIRFGEYYYGPMLVEVCPPGPLLRGQMSVSRETLCLPLAVPCMEGIFFFTGWIWAARREANRLLQLLAGALIAVIADVAFDPVAAKGIALSDYEAAWPGIGLWTWLLDPYDPGHFFGIPVDNPLAWLASCLGFGFAAQLLPRWRRKDPAQLHGWGMASLAAQVSLLGLCFAGLLFAALDLLITPPSTGEGYRLGMLFGLLGAAFAMLLVRAWRRRPSRGDRQLDAAATAAIALALLYALAALLLGYDRAELYPLWGLVAAALGAYWAAGHRRRIPRAAADA